MALHTKQQTWDARADISDIVGVLHTMETVLHEAAPDVGLSLQGYYVGGAGKADNHHGVPADDLLDVIATLTRVTAIKAEISNWDWDPFTMPGDSYIFDLWLSPYGEGDRPVRIELSARGSMNDRTADLFEAVFQKFTREIGRRNRSVWNDLAIKPPSELTAPAPAQENDVSPPVSVAPPAPPRAEQSSPARVDPPRSQDDATFMKTLTTHPLPVTVVGSIIAGGVIWLIGLSITSAQQDRPSQSPVPTTTTSESSTVSAPVQPPSSAPASAPQMEKTVPPAGTPTTTIDCVSAPTSPICLGAIGGSSRR